MVAPAPPPESCAAKEIEIVPSTLDVGIDPAVETTFELEVRLWSGPPGKRRSLPVTAACPVSWAGNSASWVSMTTSEHGTRATVRVAAGAQPSGVAGIRAKAGGIATNPGATIRGVPVPVTDQDVVHAAYTAGAPPTVVVVNGTRDHADGPNALWLSSFVRTALGRKEFGSGENPAWSAGVFDPTHGAIFHAADWTPDLDEVGPGPTPVLRMIPIALRIAVGPPKVPQEIHDEVLQDLEAANSILAEQRAGIAFELVESSTIPPPAAVFADCVTGDALTPPADRPGVLHLYYVNSMGGITGLTCPGTDARPHPTIYIATENYHAPTLVHEMGHALGLVLPFKGHTESSPGFDASNIMADEGWDADPFGRQRLTVGQAFRMNADPGSWLNTATTPSGAAPVRAATEPRIRCQCGAGDPTGFCPRLSDDVARPREGAGTAYRWQCQDRLDLPTLPEDQTVAGLFAGRRWRDPVGRCQSGLPGARDDQFEATFLTFENLTRPGSCPAWAAVFFSNHGPIFQTLADRPDLPWTDTADQRPLEVEDDLPPVRAVKVVVLGSAAPSEIDEAVRVFGNRNRSGIALDILTGPSTTGPCPVSSGETIYLCSASGGSTLAQRVGIALGLPLIPQADQDDAAFAHNAMQPQASRRGERLTLGQLFRIHSMLGTAGFPDCSTPGAGCPKLSADLAP